MNTEQVEQNKKIFITNAVEAVIRISILTAFSLGELWLLICSAALQLGSFGTYLRISLIPQIREHSSLSESWELLQPFQHSVLRASIFLGKARSNTQF